MPGGGTHRGGAKDAKVAQRLLRSILCGESRCRSALC